MAGEPETSLARTAWQAPPTELWQTEPAPVPPPRRFPRWMVAVGAVTAVLAVPAFLVGLLWPRSGGDPARPLAFHALNQVGTIELDDETRASLVQLAGDRVYLVAERTDGWAVIAANLAGEVAWDRPLENVSGVDPGQALAVVDGVLLLTADVPVPGTGTVEHRVAIDTTNGHEAWRRPRPSDDQTLAFSSVVVWADHERRELLGLDPRTGQPEWEWTFPGEPDDPIPGLVPVLVEADLAGRSGVGSTHDLPRHGEHVLLIGGDRAAAVFDIRNGRPLSRGPGVIGSRDRGFALADRLFVASADDGRVYRFDLTDLNAPPAILFTSGEDWWSPQEVVPCGPDQVCIRVDGAGDPEIIAVAVEGGETWRKEVPGAIQLLPAGDLLVVNTREPALVVFDPAGNEVDSRPGVAVRLNAGNLLIASGLGGFGTVDLSLAGVAVAGFERTELGLARDVRAGGCAWDERHLACPTRDGAAIWQFAAE